VPLELYWKNGRAKVQIGLAKGKKQHDKRAVKRSATGSATRRACCDAAEKTRAEAPRWYAAHVKSEGATGFDAGCEPSGAYRGAVPSLILLQIIVANDDNYALAA